MLRGQKLTLLKAHPHPWHVFITVLGEEETVEESTQMDSRIDGGGQARLLGQFEHRPDYQNLDELVRASQKESPPRNRLAEVLKLDGRAGTRQSSDPL